MKYQLVTVFDKFISVLDNIIFCKYRVQRISEDLKWGALQQQLRAFSCKHNYRAKKLVNT